MEDRLPLAVVDFGEITMKTSDSFELRRASGKGEGVFATKPFKAGDIVMVGIIKEVLPGNDPHASQIGENEYVRHAGLIPKVNHSCDPNCGIRVNETGAHDFVAMRDIGLNEEIVSDYAMRNLNVDFLLDQCMCGSKKCRDRITGWKDLPADKKREYANFAAPYLIELDTKHLYKNVGHRETMWTPGRWEDKSLEDDR